MTSLIAPARVIPVLRAKNLPQVIERLTRRAAATAYLNQVSAMGAVLLRREASPFPYGRGVALPHAMIGGLDEPLGVFARLEPALDLDAPDNEPVDLALLILSPEGDHATLLRALACVARRLRDPDVAARLRSADGAEAVHAVLTSDAWRGEAGGAELSSAEGPHGGDLTKAAKWPTIEVLC